MARRQTQCTDLSTFQGHGDYQVGRYAQTTANSTDPYGNCWQKRYAAAPYDIRHRGEHYSNGRLCIVGGYHYNTGYATNVTWQTNENLYNNSLCRSYGTWITSDYWSGVWSYQYNTYVEASVRPATGHDYRY